MVTFEKELVSTLLIHRALWITFGQKKPEILNELSSIYEKFSNIKPLDSWAT